MQGYDLYTPGYFRINFNYFVSDEVQEYCLKAIEFIADNAIYLLPLYQSDMKTAEFVHR